MNDRFKNSLRFYTFEVNESPETAEAMAKDFEDKFTKLDKWSQVNLSLVIETQGWEKAFEDIETL